jgi:hypothetical protein
MSIGAYFFDELGFAIPLPFEYIQAGDGFKIGTDGHAQEAFLLEVRLPGGSFCDV